MLKLNLTGNSCHNACTSAALQNEHIGHISPTWWPSLTTKERRSLGRAFVRAVMEKSVIHPRGRLPKLNIDANALMRPVGYWPKSTYAAILSLHQIASDDLPRP